MNDTPNALDVIPGPPHQPATPPKIEIFDYQEPQADTPDDTHATTTARWRRPTTITDLKQRLAHARAVNAIKRQDKQLRRVQAVKYRAAMADAAEWSTTVERNRQERSRDATEAAGLAQLHRQAARSGERARIRADIQRSAEMRALRIAKVRRYTMWVGVPVMVGFAAISTPGVQKGMVNVLNLDTGSMYWWTAWAVEPLLIAVATSIIVVKSVLKMSGGHTDWKADTAKWGALLFSIALNMLGGWTGDGDTATAVGEALGHSVGALGAAVTAWLIGVIVDYASKAKPWDNAPRLADLGLLPTVTGDAIVGELVTPSGDAPTVSDADRRQAVTAVTETPAVTATADSDAPASDAADTIAVTSDRRPSPSPRPAVTVAADVTSAKRHTVTATVTRPAVTYKRVTVTPAVTSDATDGSDAATVTTDATDTDADASTVTSDTTPAGDADATVTEVGPLSRDRLDDLVRNWTVEQVRNYASGKARQVVDAGGTKKDGMNEYVLTCLALSVLPAGKWAAEAVGGAESAGRTLRTKLLRELSTLADADRILMEAHNRIVAEVTAGGDGRD